MSAAISFRSSVLPWALAQDDERRFRTLFSGIVGATLVLAGSLQFIKLRAPEHPLGTTLPPVAARLLVDMPVAPPPQPTTQKLQAPRPDAADRRAPAPLPTQPVPRERPVVEARQPVPAKPPGEDRAAARAKAAGVGLLAALKDQPPELRGAPLAVQLNQSITRGTGVGTGVGVGVGAGKTVGLPDRSMITSNATGGSGGIDTAGFSRDSGGGGLAGRSTTLVAGVAAGGGGGGAGLGGTIAGAGGHGAGAGAPSGKGATIQRGGSGKASRSQEELALAVARAKGALYAIYNRALREDASLQGKVTVEFTIAPNGGITDCHIKSSELKSPELEQKLISRLRMLEFKPEDVDTMIASYSIAFVPNGS